MASTHLLASCNDMRGEYSPSLTYVLQLAWWEFTFTDLLPDTHIVNTHQLASCNNMRDEYSPALTCVLQGCNSHGEHSPSLTRFLQQHAWWVITCTDLRPATRVVCIHLHWLASCPLCGEHSPARFLPLMWCVLNCSLPATRVVSTHLHWLYRLHHELLWQVHEHLEGGCKVSPIVHTEHLPGSFIYKGVFHVLSPMTACNNWIKHLKHHFFPKNDTNKSLGNVVCMFCPCLLSFQNNELKNKIPIDNDR